MNQLEHNLKVMLLHQRLSHACYQLHKRHGHANYLELYKRWHKVVRRSHPYVPSESMRRALSMMQERQSL